MNRNVVTIFEQGGRIFDFDAVQLAVTPAGASDNATRYRSAQRREGIARSRDGRGAPCERCDRELCLPGDHLGPRCRGAVVQMARRVQGNRP